MVGWAARSQPEITDEVCLRALPHQVLHRGRQGQAEDPEDPLQDLRERHHDPRRGGGQRAAGRQRISAVRLPPAARHAPRVGRMAPRHQRPPGGPAGARRAGDPHPGGWGAATRSTSGTSTSTAGRNRRRFPRSPPRCARGPRPACRRCLPGSAVLRRRPPGALTCPRPVEPAAVPLRCPRWASLPAAPVDGRGGGAAAAAAYAPISEQEELGEKTQISSLDASLLAPEAAPVHARSGRHAAVPSSFPALADLFGQLAVAR